MLEIPRGLEVLVKKAAVDTAFRDCLLRERDRAAGRIGLVLEPAEAALIRAIPAAQLAAVIAGTTVPPRFRAAFMGYAAAAMLAAVGLSTGCTPIGERDGKGTSVNNPAETTYRVRLPKSSGDTTSNGIYAYKTTELSRVFFVGGATPRGNRSFDNISARMDRMTIIFFRDYRKYCLPKTVNPGGHIILDFSINQSGRVVSSEVLFDTYNVPSFNQAVLKRLNNLNFGVNEVGTIKVGYLFSTGSDASGLYPPLYYRTNLKDFFFGDITDLDIVATWIGGIRPGKTSGEEE